MVTALEQLLESPENLEYLARQSRRFRISPLSLYKLAQQTVSGIRPTDPSFQRLLQLLSEHDRRRQLNPQKQLFEVSQEWTSDIHQLNASIIRLLNAIEVDFGSRQTELQEGTAYDAAQRLGIIGVIKSTHRDLSTNPKHFDGFGA